MFESSNDRELKRRDLLCHAAGLGVTVLIAAAALMLVFGPLERHRIALDRTARAHRAFLARGNELRVEHADLTRQEAAIASKLANLLKRIPEAPQEAEFLAALSSLAGETTFAILEYRPVGSPGTELEFAL